MIKLEQKLIELGYEIYHKDEYSITWCKSYSIGYIHIEIRKDKIINSCIKSITDLFFTQNHIDYLQQTFNEMQKDLNILKEIGYYDTK